jgi:hypothetical protein
MKCPRCQHVKPPHARPSAANAGSDRPLRCSNAPLFRLLTARCKSKCFNPRLEVVAHRPRSSTRAMSAMTRFVLPGDAPDGVDAG